MNKNDLFERTVKHVPIKEFFPARIYLWRDHPTLMRAYSSAPLLQDYDGAVGDPAAGRQFFLERFRKLAGRAKPDKDDIYYQYVTPA